MQVYRENKNAELREPRSGDVGYDIVIPYNVTLPPHTPVKLETGIHIALPDQTAGLIWDKSSVGVRGVKVLGGLIDTSYRGDLTVVLINLTNEPVEFLAGQKVAQLILVSYTTPVISFVSNLDDLGKTERGEGGFGSTGNF